MQLDIHKPYGSLPSLPNFKRPQIEITPRVCLYGAMAVLVIATLMWTNQKVSAIDKANSVQLESQRSSFSATQAAALQNWTITVPDLLSKAAKLANKPQHDVAIEMLEEAKRRDPQNRDVLLQLGYAYLQANRVADAKATLEAAKLVDPGYPTTYQLLAVAYAKTGDSKNATLAADRAKQFEQVAKLTDIVK